jgi:diacylglycerol O-acyltransferase / trehalose O-mycolyltransferase
MRRHVADSPNRATARALTTLRGVEPYYYGPGTHTWPYWERELHRSLPLLLGALRGGRESAHTAAA